MLTKRARKKHPFANKSALPVIVVFLLVLKFDDKRSPIGACVFVAKHWTFFLFSKKRRNSKNLRVWQFFAPLCSGHPIPQACSPNALPMAALLLKEFDGKFEGEDNVT